MTHVNAFNDNCYGFQFQHSYSQLPAVFHQQQLPSAVKNPHIVLFNDALAAMLNVNADTLKKYGAAFLCGNSICSSSLPIAQAYAGHQFGGFNMLGDGRAILLGEHTNQQRQLVDVQLKGAGRTPYSRGGDGRAALGPMLREYIMSEAMHALGIPSTRSLAVTSTGEDIYRDAVLPGAVLTRIAASHIRVGTFQFAAATQNIQHIKALADYTIKRHFSDIAEDANPYSALLQRVIELQASLIAQWMQVGFIHGVMNTDNMSIAGETIDYGPCAMMNAYHIETAYSSIDVNGRYAFGNQPNMALWNLTRFAETLIPLIHASTEKSIALATDSLEAFMPQYHAYWLAGMRKKLGFFNDEIADTKLIDDLLKLMQQQQADFTNTFRLLAQKSDSEEMKSLESLTKSAAWMDWNKQWQARLTRQKQPFSESIVLMQSVNPQVIARNHLVEDALNAANKGDLLAIENLLTIVAKPYVNINHPDKYTQASTLEVDAKYKTYCGT